MYAIFILELCISQYFAIKVCTEKSSVVDPFHFDPDPDPFPMITDPDPGQILTKIQSFEIS